MVAEHLDDVVLVIDRSQKGAALPHPVVYERMIKDVTAEFGISVTRGIDHLTNELYGLNMFRTEKNG